jgi:hypothetical protein
VTLNADHFDEPDYDPESCPRESDGRHRWHYDEPPEHMMDEIRDWDDAAWADWYDQADRTCYSCGMRSD